MRKLLLASLLVLSLGAAARAADGYTIDKDHSTVGFSVRHLAVSNTHGRFAAFGGAILLDEKDPSKSSVKVTIKTTSVDTGNEKRDNHLRSGDFFEVDKYPEISFVSKKVEKKGDAYQMAGTLTIKGVSKDVSIPFTLSGPVKDPWGNMRLGAEGSLVVNRQDFKVAASSPVDAAIGNDVKIELTVEATQDKPK